MTEYSVAVSRAELARGLRLVTVGVRGKTTHNVRFSVVNGFLEMMGPGAAHSIAAEGRWPSAILANAGVLKRVASRLPLDDPLVLKVENSRLYIGTFSVGATVLDIAPIGTQLPIGVSAAEILIAIEQLGEARVVGSIGTKVVEDAREHLTGRIEQAVQALGPYGIAHTDLVSMVRRAINERAISKASANQPVKNEDNRDTPSGTPLPPSKGNADHDLARKMGDTDEQATEYTRAPSSLYRTPHLLKQLKQTPELNSYLGSVGRQVDHLVSDCWSCPTHDAILEFTRERYSALARRALFQLQRIKASGVYGDDYRHKTLWDEYCHEVQEGPYDVLDEGWDKTLGPVLRAIVEAIPPHEGTLLSISAIWDLDEAEEPSRGVNPELIQQNLQQILSKIAGARDMSRFDPTLF